MSKLLLVGVGATAYVLGARAGRERYEQITRTARDWYRDPRIQDTTSRARDVIKQKAPDADQLADTAKRATQKIRSNGDGSHADTEPAAGSR